MESVMRKEEVKKKGNYVNIPLKEPLLSEELAKEIALKLNIKNIPRKIKNKKG